MKVLFISHDASRTGAPISLLNLIKAIRLKVSDIQVTLLLLDGGPLFDEFKEVSDVFIYKSEFAKPYKRIFTRFSNGWLKKLIKQHRSTPFDLIFANTVVTANYVNLLIQKLSCKSLLWIHEHEFTINYYYPNWNDSNVINKVDLILAVSNYSKELIVKKYNLQADKVYVVGECIQVSYDNNVQDYNTSIFQSGYKYVAGCGLGSWRKGIDLFILLARYVQVVYPFQKIKFIWIGEINREAKTKLDYELERFGIKNIIFTGQVKNTQTYFRQIDVFALTSREDPFPLVALEAAMNQKPIICFDQTGGMVEFVSQGAGIVVPYADFAAMGDTILKILNDTQLLNDTGSRGQILASNYKSEITADRILDLICKLVD